jgi:glycosyltransferase involved in cell wall biosynthesis/peptidoglycan/xylan/chitin deacetylase (PgdA/CDA1 family)
MSGQSGLPSFSVVIPTHQRRDLVSRAVRALAEIDYGGQIELIVSADGCTDGTADAIRDIECPFPLRIIEQAQGGAAQARNRGAAAAAGEVLLFLDDDMVAQRDLLTEHARMYADGADAVLGHIPVHPDSPPGFLTDDAACFATSMLSQGRLTGLDVFTGQLSVRRRVFEEIGGFDERFTSGDLLGMEDADFGIRLLARYRLSHSARAVSHQHYIVTPRESMRRQRRWAAADVRFARKYPQVAGELFKSRGAGRPMTRLLYQPLSRIPLVPQVLAATAVRLSEWALKSPFRSNRLVARFFAASRAIAYWQGVRLSGGMPRSKRLLILCYHAIRDLSGDPVMGRYGLPRGAFARQLDQLHDAGFSFVTPDEAAALLDGRGRLPKKAVLLTFDDCYEELADVAANLLAPREIGAIAFAVTGMPSGTNEWDQRIGARTLRLLDTAGLVSLTRFGIELGSHSRSHRPLPDLDDAEVRAETAGSMEDFVKSGLPRPRFFAYPHGDNDQRTRNAVMDAGFEAAFTLGLRRTGLAAERFSIPRVVIEAKDVGWRFRAKTTFRQLSYLLESRILQRTVDAVVAFRARRPWSR